MTSDSNSERKLDELRETDRPRASAFPWYLLSSSLWMAGMSLQGLLISWLIVGELETPADTAGFARMLIDLPPLLILLVGGLLADRNNGRTFLTWMHVLMALPPLLLAWVAFSGELSLTAVVCFGLAISAIQATSDPARQSVLSRVTRIDIQRTITLTTIVTSMVGIGGFYVGGELEAIGLTNVLLLQAGLFLAGIVAVRALPSMPIATIGVRPNFADGWKALKRAPLVRQIVGLNFLSSLFNAGAYIIAIPFIATEVYGGDASFLAGVMIVFTVGSVGSNVLLFLVMPLLHPGRLFLLMQLTRMVILGALFLQPPLWLFYLLMVAWGLNMGVTTTLVRSTVQELAPAETRAQILSFLLLSFMVSSAISSPVLGQVIAFASPLAALLPGIAFSLLIFGLGLWRTGLWRYTSDRR